jgi:hypothetical protein
MDAALAADDLCVRALEALLAHGALDARGGLVKALVRESGHMVAARRADEAEAIRARARELDATAFAAAMTERQQRTALPPPVTLRRALELSENQADSAPMASFIDDPRDPKAAPSLSERYVPQAAVMYAVDFAERCLKLLPTKPVEGLRLGLEAHYVFAIESRRQTPQMRYQLAEFGPHWARALLSCARFYAVAGNGRMAEDLAGWLRGVALGLAPFGFLQREIAGLVDDCSKFADQYPADHSS